MKIEALLESRLIAANYNTKKLLVHKRLLGKIVFLWSIPIEFVCFRIELSHKAMAKTHQISRVNGGLAQIGWIVENWISKELDREIQYWAQFGFYGCTSDYPDWGRLLTYPKCR